MSEELELYAGQPRHNPALQCQVVQLARLLAVQDNQDLFALFCATYYTARGESANVRDRLLRLVELIAEHPRRGELWPEIEEAYRIRAAEGRLE